MDIYGSWMTLDDIGSYRYWMMLEDIILDGTARFFELEKTYLNWLKKNVASDVGSYVTDPFLATLMMRMLEIQQDGAPQLCVLVYKPL